MSDIATLHHPATLDNFYTKLNGWEESTKIKSAMIIKYISPLSVCLPCLLCHCKNRMRVDVENVGSEYMTATARTLEL